jgi:putative ABC transport system permease protein
MRILRTLFFRLQPFFRRRKIEAELSEEMRTHLEMQTEANIAAGMSPEEARGAALREFGGVDQVKESWRDERSLPWLEDSLRDLRFAVRALRKNPGFTLAVVATLAIGIGATTAFVNIGRQALFPTIPYPEPERVVIVNNIETIVPHLQVPYPFFAFPYRFAALREAVTSFAGLGAERRDSLNLVVNGDPVAAEVGWVTADFFAVLGAKSQQGRLFLPDEYHGTNGDVAVLSCQIWQDRFAADPGIVGRDILLGGKSRRVVGVLPKSFAPPLMFMNGEIYLPEAPSPTAAPWPFPFQWMQVVGRLKPGVPREQAEAETVVITGRDPGLKSADALERAKPRLVPLTTYYPNGASNLFWLFLAAVGFLYVIACSNAASLILARTVARRRELGVRLAMGGSRWQIARLLLAESLLLSLAGGGLGLMIAAWSCSAWKVFFNGDSPIDWVTLVAALVTSILTCGLVVLVPIGRIRRTGLHEVMQEGSGALGDSRIRRGAGGAGGRVVGRHRIDGEEFPAAAAREPGLRSGRKAGGHGDTAGRVVARSLPATGRSFTGNPRTHARRPRGDLLGVGAVHQRIGLGENQGRWPAGTRRN